MREWLIYFLLWVAVVFSGWLVHDLGGPTGAVIDTGVVVAAVLLLWVMSWE